jgi:phosphatidate cytidylyltransferase
MNQQPNNQPLDQSPNNNEENAAVNEQPPVPTAETLEPQNQSQGQMPESSVVAVPFAPIVPPLPPTEEAGTMDFSTGQPELAGEEFDFATEPIVVPGTLENLEEHPLTPSGASELQNQTENLQATTHHDETSGTSTVTQAPPATPSEKSNLVARVITAIVGIPLVTLLVWRAEAPVFNLAIAFLALLGLRELSKALRAAQMPLVGSLAYPALIALLFVQPLTVNYPRWGAMIIWLMPFLLMVSLLITSVLRYPSSGRISLQSIALTLFATLYVGLFVFLILLRSLRTGPLDFLDDAPRLGHALLWLTLVSVWSGDIIAYFAGRHFVSRKSDSKKLTVLSPGKTWAGAIAGFAATVAVCVPIAVRLQFEIRHGLALGVLIALAAPLGDLAESFWKRELAIKDMGGVLPGHGGILDRCDSLLFAAFAVYLYAQIWMI